MANEELVRVKGKANTLYEGKEGWAPKVKLYDIHGKKCSLTLDTPILVLWDGEKEKEFVRLSDLDMIE